MNTLGQACGRLAGKWLWRLCASIMTGTACAAEVSTFALGRSSQPGLYYAPPFLHGAYAFESIRITFNTDVVVDFYDLQLQSLGVATNQIPVTGFSYDPVSRAATWTIDEQVTMQNARYLATLTGVRDTGGGLLPGGIYTNDFSILTCDVTGDNQISPVDALVIINHINAGLPYQPALDVNWDGVIDAADTLIVINFLDLYGTVSLVAPGPYRTVPMIPFANPVITNIRTLPAGVVVEFSGVPTGRQTSIKGKVFLSDADWYAVLDFERTNGMKSVTFAILSYLPSEFYRMSVR